MLDDLTLHQRSEKLARHYADKLPHGLIIEGVVGTGVASVAKALAAHINSPAFVIEPKKKVKNEWVIDQEEGSVVIDDIRALYEQTRTRQPGEQVYIIDTGQKSITTAAQNAFLKLLEEPRSGVHFIIATHQLDQLLPTIISRTQRLSLLPITDEQTQRYLAGFELSDDIKRARLAFVGRGRPGLIKRLAENDELYAARVAIMTDAKILLSGSQYDKLIVIHNYKDNRGDSLTLLDDMNRQLQTIIQKQPDWHLAADIDKYLAIREKVALGGNIRLQLASAVV